MLGTHHKHVSTDIMADDPSDSGAVGCSFLVVDWKCVSPQCISMQRPHVNAKYVVQECERVCKPLIAVNMDDTPYCVDCSELTSVHRAFLF